MPTSPSTGLAVPAWRGRAAWSILDTDFGTGNTFLAHWAAWEQDAHRPAMLHYVAISAAAPHLPVLLQGLAGFAPIAAQAQVLSRQCFGLLPGCHRIELSHGRVLLTLCVGDLQELLREQQFIADAVSLGIGDTVAWDRWTTKALTRLCRRGTLLDAPSAINAMVPELEAAGWRWETHAADGKRTAVYDPHWNPGSTRQHWRAPRDAASSCAIVGAGLAGASAAASLARRGWQVEVLDAAAAPASGASGLPVGLLAPQVSRDDGARSRLVRAGLRLTLQWCHALLRTGEEWAPSGVLQMRPDGTPELPPGWPAEGREWSDTASDTPQELAWGQGCERMAPPLHHRGAGWVKPARLVAACLNHAGIRFTGSAHVAHARRDGGDWVLTDPGGRPITRARHLVLATAGGTPELLQRIAMADPLVAPGIPLPATLQRIGGQISWGLQGEGDAAVLPPLPVNGSGSLIANLPWNGARAWVAGATFETSGANERDEAAAHRENLQRLTRLLPRAGQLLQARFDSAQVRAWHGWRCSTRDRLPLVGPVQHGPAPSLWLSTAMGSRGLTYCVLCAELLAARIGAEPLPVEHRLARLLDASRRTASHHL